MAVPADGAQYLLPDGGAVALSERLDLRAAPARSVDRTFYDTFDGRLRARGSLLVHDGRRLALVDAATEAERAAIAQPQRPERLVVGELPSGRLRDLLAPIVAMRAVMPVARVRSRLRALRVLNADAKTVVRLVVEEAPALLDARKRTGLGPRVHLIAVRGYGKELARVRRTLERDVGLEAADEPLVDEAVRAAGGIPGGMPSKLELSLAPEQRAGSAAAALLTGLLAAIEANLPGTLADVDSEFLHDLRVAVRRTRAAQGQLKGVFAPAPLARFRADFRRLQQVTGPTRDLDVYLLELDELRASLSDDVGPDLEPLCDLLRARRVREQRRMVRVLRSSRTKNLLAEWRGFLTDFDGDARHADGLDAARPIGELAGERIARVYRRMVKAGSAIDDTAPAEALHDLRKAGKELRYLLEFFGGLYPREVVKPMVATLKALQDTLGRFQDREVQAQVLRDLRNEVAPLDDGPAALMAMGLLVDRLHDQQRSARSEFAQRFEAFAAKPQRKLVRATFG